MCSLLHMHLSGHACHAEPHTRLHVQHHVREGVQRAHAPGHAPARGGQPASPCAPRQQPRHHRRGAAAPARASAEPVHDGQAAGVQPRWGRCRRLQTRQRVSGSGLLHASPSIHLSASLAEVYSQVHWQAICMQLCQMVGVSLLGGSCFTFSPKRCIQVLYNCSPPVTELNPNFQCGCHAYEEESPLSFAMAVQVFKILL